MGHLKLIREKNHRQCALKDISSNMLIWIFKWKRKVYNTLINIEHSRGFKSSLLVLGNIAAFV